jgi:peptide/nickel transport system permease protein
MRLHTTQSLCSSIPVHSPSAATGKSKLMVESNHITRDFIRAARYMGVPTRTIVFRHLIPNVASILIIAATLDVGGTILSETGLSYLGFGIQPPDVSLGSLIADGTNSALTYPWLFCFAGGALVLTVLSVSFIGDGLRDAFDPGASTGAKS